MNAPQPPFPEDPFTCQWCGLRRHELISGDLVAYVCDSGCAPNGLAPYLVQCGSCRRDFRTGLRYASLCYECDQKERAAVNPEPAEYQTYNYSRIKRGGYRD